MEDREIRWRAAMQAAATGDRKAYAALLSAIGDRVRHYAGRRVTQIGAGPEDVEDIVQDVLFALHTKRDTWEPTRPFCPWVDAIIRYKTADALRRLGRRRAMTSDSMDRVAATVAAPLPTMPVDASGDIRRYLSALPRRERGVVAALGLDGMTIAGCAERFGISEGAVRVAFHRGLARLSRFAETDNPAAVAQPGRSGR